MGNQFVRYFSGLGPTVTAYSSNISVRETVLNGFFTIDKNWTVKYCNEVAEKMIGAISGIVLGKNLRKEFGSVIPLGVYDVLQRGFLKESPMHFEEYPGALGNWFDIILYHCEDQVSVSFKSIHQPSKVEDLQQQIIHLNGLYRVVTELTNDCLWEWNLETKEIFWIDGGHKRVFGYEIENALIPQIFWENRIHPEDRKRVLISLENIRVLNPSMIWQQEYRFRKADGQYIQVRDQGKLLRDKDQDMFRMIGTTTDISVEKSLELELVSERLKKKAVISMEGFRAQENERFDIASELHNNLGQILCAAKLHIEFASSHEESRPDCLALASQYVVTVINEIRAVCKKLRMPGMYQGFFESVRHAIQNLNRNYPVFIEFNVVYYTGKKRI